MSLRSSLAVAAAVAVALPGLLLVAQSQTPQVPGAIRSRITLVPLDIRVVDRDGRPVIGLTESDFVIRENGVPQAVAHFSFVQLEPGPPGPARPPLRRALDATIEEQSHRTFLLVFGRGRLQSPARGYDGALKFVRESLLPQDKVAIAAWNRTTDFTTDHAALIPLLERLRKGHERIEQQLRQRESGLEAIYGSKQIPANIQTSIDALFGDGVLRPRQLAAVQIRDEAALDNTLRAQTDAMMERMAGEGARLEDPALEAFYAQAMVGRQSLASLYASIEYLKYFDGEKHLILLSQDGIYLPRAEDDRGLAATAADARVAVHTILTGGVPIATDDLVTRQDPRVLGSSGPLKSAFDQAVVGSSGGRFAPLFAAGTLRTFANLSGGYSFFSQPAERAFAKIDDTTRSHYVLGYYPANANWDGSYRRVDVRVNRPDVTVSVRRGYFASDQLVPFDRRQFLTHSRLSSAGYYSKPITDIAVSAEAVVSGSQLVVTGTIDPSRLTTEPVDGARDGEIDLAVYAGDRDEQIVGEVVTRLSIRGSGAAFERAAATGIPFEVRVPITGKPRYVKVIVYDYASDLVGSVMVKLR